jgi:trimethylamine--corrinoid protein Co-methyltransferase
MFVTRILRVHDAVEMAEAVVGGPDALRQNPLAACYINVTTGLRHNQEALQKLLYLAGKGLPLTYVPSTQGGVTAPVTPAGAMAVARAGRWSGLVLSQLKREGAPFIMPGWGGNMLNIAPPSSLRGPRQTGGVLISSYLGLLCFLAGCSDSKAVDQQAGIGPANMMTDAGRQHGPMTITDRG